MHQALPYPRPLAARPMMVHQVEVEPGEFLRLLWDRLEDLGLDVLSAGWDRATGSARIEVIAPPDADATDQVVRARLAQQAAHSLRRDVSVHLEMVTPEAAFA